MLLFGFRATGADGPVRFNGHPPLGVNATDRAGVRTTMNLRVSMGTHPWG